MATIAFNVGNFVIVRLNNNNYPFWCKQLLALVETQDLVDHLFREDSAPPEFDSPLDGASSSSKLEQTPNYLQWHKSDRLLRGWIISTL